MSLAYLALAICALSMGALVLDWYLARRSMKRCARPITLIGAPPRAVLSGGEASFLAGLQQHQLEQCPGKFSTEDGGAAVCDACGFTFLGDGEPPTHPPLPKWMQKLLYRRMAKAVKQDRRNGAKSGTLPRLVRSSVAGNVLTITATAAGAEEHPEECQCQECVAGRAFAHEFKS